MGNPECMGKERALRQAMSPILRVMEEDELRAFSKSCAESRNAISHFGGQRSGDYSDFIHDLSIKSDALKFLYHSLILHYINVDDDILKSWLYDGYESYKNKRMLSAVHLLNLSS